MWKGEQRSCIEMYALTGELKEWVICRNLCFSLFEWGKEKRKGGKLDKGDRVVPPGPWAEF